MSRNIIFVLMYHCHKLLDLKFPKSFTEPEVSSLCSQQPATGPSPDIDEQSYNPTTYPQILFP
jgi:hypothetical protein